MRQGYFIRKQRLFLTKLWYKSNPSVLFRKPSVMLERDSIDFSLIGMQEISYSLDHFVHFIFAGDTFKQFSFINKRTQDVNSGIGYLHGQGNAHRV